MICFFSLSPGHVFCLSCLIATNPSRCPLCRHEFSVHNMRKLHFTLPSARDHFARQLEMKLVQTSPDMTLVESLNLFQEVQDWLEGNSEEEVRTSLGFSYQLICADPSILPVVSSFKGFCSCTMRVSRNEG